MNKQLEDLMYKSGLTAQGCWDKMDSYDQQAILEFAQLIVQECAELAYDGPRGILEHFEVEP